MIKLFRFINTLNIDTAMGAVSFVFIVAYTQNVEVDLFVYLALIISVLSIYTLDHLVDAYWLKDAKSTYRHSFYRRYFKALLLWFFSLLMVGVWVLFQLPFQILILGAIMSVLIGLYFLIIFKYRYKNYLLREVVVAIGYTFSVGFIPFANSSIQMNPLWYGLLLIIFLVTLTNLWVFALYDFELDETQNHHSIARRIDKEIMLKLTKLVILMAIIWGGFYFLYLQFWILGFSFLIIELIYFGMLQHQAVFKKNDYYRLVGEPILILPGILLLGEYAI